MGIPFSRDPYYIPYTWFLNVFPSHDHIPYTSHPRPHTLTPYYSHASLSVFTFPLYIPTPHTTHHPPLFIIYYKTPLNWVHNS